MKSGGRITPQLLARQVEKALEAQARASHIHSYSYSTQTWTSRCCNKPTNTILRQTTPSLRRPFTNTTHRAARPPAEDPSFTSILDNPPELVRTGRRHGPGLIILAIIPVTAFLLGTWQVQRLGWKTELIAKFEDRIVREPLPLPPRIDPSAIHDFDFRRVLATGRYRHDKEMLVGPRMRDGEQGFMVITPLERGGDERATVLVNRGWIAKKFRRQQDRPVEALPHGEVEVEGLLREPWKKNMFTPENRPDINEFYFPDVKQMAALTGSQPVWIEQTMEPDLLQTLDMENKGIPIGRPAEVNLRNNHAQYIFTWYGLAVATSIMFYMVVKKPPTDISRRVRMNKEWS
ncbi:SURF1-domain-containing protein [Hypoxylon trugodes]|uniref:SURF1-domain-containing protein n=1 Tax=Hypoxylon trugodes TaxID=326681 RepID=UPI002198C780|nr:SURF1-domain-containing protein [Hypoxylon trugodes]KAI1392556.1 SURF1-domain-containing protein [Hypoxylon trugodes]